MTYLKIIVPAIILTGCSVGSNNYGHQGQSGAYLQGQTSPYTQPCHPPACASSYSVNESGYSNTSAQQIAQAYQPAAPQAHNYGAPQQPSPYAYGTQTAHYGAQHHGQGSYGHRPQLRGAYGQPNRGYKYGTLGASMYDVDSDVFGIQGRLGYQSRSLLGAELEGFAGLTKEKETVGTVTAKAGVDYTLGAFGVLRSNITPRWSGHLRAGYHVTELSGEVESGGVTIDADMPTQDGFAYGVGTEYALTPRDFIRADFTRYDQDLGTNDSVSISYGRKF